MAWTKIREAKAGAGQAFMLDCGIQFNTGSAVVHPKAMKVLASVLQYSRDNPDHKLLILSHTDKVGDPGKNQALSEDRAKSVLYLLFGAGPKLEENRTAWVQVVSERHVAQDAQDLCSEHDLDPGPRAAAGTKVLPPATRAKLKEYKASAANTLDRTGYVATEVGEKTDDETWTLSYELFRRRLAGELVLSEQELIDLCNKLPWATPDARSIGCGELYPRDTKATGASEVNRRTEFVFFPPDTTPPTKAELKTLYDGTFQVEHLPCDSIDPHLAVPSEENCVFILDVSGSMKNKDGLDQTRLDRLRPLFIELIEQYAAGNTPTTPRNFCCIAFGAQGNTIDQCLMWKKAGQERQIVNYGSEKYFVPLVPTTPEHVATMKTFLLGLAPWGGTPARSALKLAMGAAISAGKIPASCRIVFVSDGVPSMEDGDKSWQDIVNAVVKWQSKSTPAPYALPGDRKWPVDSYGFATGPGAAFMRRLALMTRGNFRFVP
jgi:hypothetical protein